MAKRARKIVVALWRLCVANKPGLRSVVWVGVGTSETKSSIPGIGGSLIAGSESEDVGLCGDAGCNSGIAGSTGVAKLVADAVGDNVWVQSLLLSLVHDRVNCLECEFSFLAAI